MDASAVPTDAPAFAMPVGLTDALLGEETEADCAGRQTAHAKIATTHGVDRLNHRIADRRRRLLRISAPFTPSYSRWAAEWKMVNDGRCCNSECEVPDRLEDLLPRWAPAMQFVTPRLHMAS